MKKRDTLPRGYKFALVGNPNVGKSTVFNAITGLNQHTGNWTGKTVEICEGEFVYKGSLHSIVDLPGTYSLLAESEEEKVTAEFIEKSDYDCIIIVADSSTIYRNLNLIIHLLSKTSEAVLALNMSDIAAKNGVNIDTDELNLRLGIPVIPVTAKKNSDVKALLSAAISVADKSVKTYRIKSITDLSKIADAGLLIDELGRISKETSDAAVKHDKRTFAAASKADRLATGKISGTILMLIFIFVLFWLTAYGSNYPGQVLGWIISRIIESVAHLLTVICVPDVITAFICDGVLNTAGWVISVMLPPAMIFFPLFAVLEDWGYLPRVAFNLDGIFSASGTNGKQALTMLMGFGCNSCGVVGCRIMPSVKERNIAILTNSFIPCNGRLPMLLTLGSVFFSSEYSGIIGSLITALILVLLLLLSFVMTLLVSKIISLCYKGINTDFILELPCYKKPKIIKTIAVSLKEKVLTVLLRAVAVALPAGVVIWLLSNLIVNGSSLLQYITDFFDPFAKLLGLDGTILTAYILGFPANEIVTPVMAMAYSGADTLSQFSSVYEMQSLLTDNGWTQLTAICTMILCVFHFPCSTTCITIYKETKSKTITLLSIIVPLITGFILCGLVNLLYHIFF